MPISNELFLSILAMDAYNCGYNATVGEALTGLPGNQIGNATIRRDINLPEGSQSASFYAQAYTWNGRTIISYRGTDGLLFNSVPTDIPDWGIWFADNYKHGPGPPRGGLLPVGGSNRHAVDHRDDRPLPRRRPGGFRRE